MVLPKIKKYWRKMMKKEKEKEKEKEIMISSKKNTTMDVPNDVIIEIFSRLTLQTLLRFRWVCKSWFNLIRDPCFVNMQLNNNKHTSTNPLVLIYSLDNIIENNLIEFNAYDIIDTDDDHALLCPNSLVSAKVPSVTNTHDSIKILGSCNGLLCISVRPSSSFRQKRYFIWNPCTKEFKEVHNNGSTYLGSRYGFGYDRTVDDYKLVKTALIGGSKTCECYVYTLGTSSWKRIHSPYQCILCSAIEEYNTNGVFINGHLYYTAKKTIWPRTFDIIVSFDVAKEEYGQIPIPVINDDEFSDPIFLNLGELKGCLCLLRTLFGTLDSANEVWMIRHNAANNIDVNEEYTWEKLCTISTNGRWVSLTTKLLRICKNGEILMVVEESIFRKEIVLYDPMSDKTTCLHKLSEEEDVENYMQSLVPLTQALL